MAPAFRLMRSARHERQDFGSHPDILDVRMDEIARSNGNMARQIKSPLRLKRACGVANVSRRERR
ncbi:MAG TPA: hypothetical protein VGL08_19105 [Paraburkholderia sp.]|jgi:hypothetical protein